MIWVLIVLCVTAIVLAAIGANLYLKCKEIKLDSEKENEETLETLIETVDGVEDLMPQDKAALIQSLIEKWVIVTELRKKKTVRIPTETPIDVDVESAIESRLKRINGEE